MPPLILKEAYWKILSRVNRRNLRITGLPTVSFTFDDFPKSALAAGGAILKQHGLRGTYYAAMGLMNCINQFGEHFDAQDLEQLLRDGHELGGHTYSHVSCREMSALLYRKEVTKGQAAVMHVTGCNKTPSFAYPMGHVNISAKKAAGAESYSCRCSRAGINRELSDRNLLRANRLYMDFAAVEDLVSRTLQCKGWLIFYTHDVCSNPSPFGCTPEYFDRVVQLTMHAGLRILPVGEALSSYLQAGDSTGQTVAGPSAAE